VTACCSEEAVRFMLTETCWDIAREPDMRALVLLSLENEELMLTTPTATQVRGDDTPCAADVLRWRLYEHLEAILARSVRRLLTARGVREARPEGTGIESRPVAAVDSRP
jgi:hypothetical protein